MANFSIAFKKTVGHEGGYVPSDYAIKVQDSGGETYMGIARNYNPEWEGWAIIDRYKAQFGVPKWNFFFPESLGLSKMVEAQAKKKYWDAINGDQIQNQELANLLFELYWGSGGLGIKQAQRSLNKVIDRPVAVDGVLGKDTLTAINSADQSALYEQIYNDRKGWYESKLQAGNPNAKGWLNRLAKYPVAIAVLEKAQEVATQAQVTAGVAAQKAKENPVMVLIAMLFLTGGAAMAYYYYFQQQNKLQ